MANSAGKEQSSSRSIISDLDPISKMLETCCNLEAPFVSYTQENLIFSMGVKEAYLLGRKFECSDGLTDLRQYVTSRLWFTYRKNFNPIGGTGPESDQGWGCMLRCAQMLLAETLLRRHLGRHFSWKAGMVSDVYEQILRMFLDEKSSLYSIHQIAQMGVTEGKAVGEWFGPNTAAQVLKKLAVFDTWSNIAVHVALDNILVVKDVSTIATMLPPIDAVKVIGEDGNVDISHLSIIHEPDSETSVSSWRPLLIIIPLRLGLTTINKCYLPAIQKYFELDSCVGIIGGRPNHALYFIGIAGERFIYLDPHYCRPALSECSKKQDKGDFMAIEEIEAALEATPSSRLGPSLDDTTYHCEMLLSMDYDQVDPSLALAFFCQSAEDFNKLASDLRNTILNASNPPLFELLEKRPSYLPPFEPYRGVDAKIEMKEFDDMCAPNYVIDDGFEVLEEEDQFSEL